MNDRPQLVIAIAYCINDIARMYRTCFDREMSAHGLTRSQWWLLANLQYNDGVSQQRLAELLEMGKSAVGKLVDQLERKGWIERRPNPCDRRAYEIYLTPKIEPLNQEIESQAVELIERSLSNLNQKSREALLVQLEGIKQTLSDI